MANELIIGLCTSNSRLSAAVYDGQKFRRSRHKIFNQEKILFRTLGLLLPEGKKLSDVKKVCVVRGPGRFTGLRIALTFAAAMKVLNGAEVLTFTLFELFAAQLAESEDFLRMSAGVPGDKIVAVLLHAFKDEYFRQYFRVPPGGRPEAEGAPAWLPVEKLKEELAGKKDIFCAVADSEEKEDIYSLLPENVLRASAGVSRLRPEYLIRTALACGKCDLKPLYLKPARYETDRIARNSFRAAETGGGK